MSVEMALPIDFSDAAALKVRELVEEEENPNLKLRVYVTGGGCSGFQYGFTFDEKVNEGDMATLYQGFCTKTSPALQQAGEGREQDVWQRGRYA